MRPSVREAFTAFSGKLEGVVPWMYLDVKGLVTVAIGNLIDPIGYALDLPFVWPDGRAATRDEIAYAWHVIKGHTELAQQGHRPAARYSTLRLTDDGVRQVVERKLDANDAALTRRFPDFQAWPAPAQLAIHSLAWACGAGFRFARLEVALRLHDWTRAAGEVSMRTEGNPGLIPRNAANRALLLQAARATDPDALEVP